MRRVGSRLGKCHAAEAARYGRCNVPRMTQPTRPTAPPPTPTPTDDTHASRGTGADHEPRLPHEQDQSADSQSDQAPANAPLGEQAHEDLDRGLVDTDRGPVTDRAYRRQQSDVPGQDTPPPTSSDDHR